jgi:hypothetical protein
MITQRVNYISTGTPFGLPAYTNLLARGPMGKYIRPRDWKALEYFPPYYISSPEPGFLQVWVKPRYWYFVLTSSLALLWCVLAILPNSEFQIWMTRIYGLFGMEFHSGHINDLHIWFPLAIIVYGVFVLMAVVIYKRHGLVEICATGIAIVANPRFFPGSRTLFTWDKIHGFEDHDLYTSIGKGHSVRSGTEFKIVLHDSRRFALFKIWGVDRLNKQDYFQLKDAFLKAYAAAKAKKPQKSAEQTNNRDEGIRNKRRIYMIWEVAVFALATLLFGLIIRYYALHDLRDSRLEDKTLLWLLASLAIAHFAMMLWGRTLASFMRLPWPLLLILFVYALAPIMGKNIRSSEIRDGASTFATVTSTRTIRLQQYFLYDVQFTYSYQQRQFSGHGLSSPEKSGTRIPLQVSRNMPKIYELHSAHWHRKKADVAVQFQE